MEKIKANIYDSANAASVVVADKIAEQINNAAVEDRSFVLGLATGSTPLGVYRELISKVRKGEISFKILAAGRHPIAKSSLLACCMESDMSGNPRIVIFAERKALAAARKASPSL